MGGTGKVLLTLSLASPSTSRFSFSLLTSSKSLSLHKSIFPFPKTLSSNRVLVGFRLRTFCSTATLAEEALEPIKHSVLLERLRLRHLKDAAKKPAALKAETLRDRSDNAGSKSSSKKSEAVAVASSFEELGLSDEVVEALKEMKISVPTEIQSIGIPAVIERKSVVLGSHTGSGKTLAYMLPLVQLLRQDEELNGILMRPRRPRAVVLCPTRELCEQVFQVAKSISHHARFRSTMISGGGRLRPQEDSLNVPIDLVVGTPGRVLQHIEDGNMVYGDIKYVVLDEADTMFDRGFGPEIRKFLAPLNNRAAKPDGEGYQTILVSATMTKGVQNLVDEEFKGIIHLRTSTLHKKIASARHDFIRLSGSENKLEALLQVLEPSLSKGNRVMVFCNTLNSSRAVDYFLLENQIPTVNYHGEVPAEERVQNLEKFKSEDGDCPTLVCTDLAARGLDLDVDHVIMFDFPLTSIDYLHRTGRTARMGAKGKVTSLVARRDIMLATRIEEAITKNESLESLSVDGLKRDNARARITEQKVRAVKQLQVSRLANKSKSTSSTKPSGPQRKPNSTTKRTSRTNSSLTIQRTSRTNPTRKTTKPVISKAPRKPASTSSSSKSKASFKVTIKKPSKSQKPSESKSPAKLNVVGFRGRSSVPN